jgi:type I restriction enzyme S subunit
MNHKIMIPELRFQEFDGEWKNRSMRDFTKINQGLQIPISERFYEKTDDNYFYITNEFLRKGSEKSYFIKNPSESVICYEDDILMTRTGNTGQVVTGVHGAFHNNFFKIKYDKTCSKWFLYYFLTSHKTQHTILKLAGTSTIPDLNHGDFYKITLNTPTFPEQQKIASFLSAVDLKIQQLSRKKELLEQYKKGVMQQLFSGKLRFKDENGNDYADWEEKKLGEIGSVISGLTYSPDDINEDGVLVLRSSNVQSRKLSFHDNVYVKTPAYNPVELNDILICVRNGSKHLIGKNTIINKETVGVAFGAFMSVYRSKYNLFLFHYFDTDEYKNEVHKNLGATINSINGSDLKKFKIPFPSIEEQQKIANFLSNIDAKIESTNQQITQTQSFKKGLLQQLFV